MGALARAQELFGTTARSEISGSSNACPIDQWMVEDYGLTIEEQFALGFALGAMTHALDEDEATGTQIYITPENLDDLFAKLRWEDRKHQVLSAIATTRESYVSEFAENGNSLEHLAWDVLPFMRHPFFMLGDGGVVLLSPRALFSWLTDGFHYRLLDAARRRSAGDHRRRISRQYTAFAGELLEDYALNVVRSVHPGERPVGGGRVYGEQPYGRVNSNGNAAEKTSDIAIDLGLDLVLMEVSVSRLRADTLLLGDTEAVAEDLERMVIKKIRQLDHCVHALIAGRAHIPANGPEVDMNRVERIWPVLVTAGNITQSAALWQYVHSQIKRELMQPKVQPLTILDVEDLETVCGLIEAGHALLDILQAKTRPPYAELELAYWLRYDPAAPREYPRPAYVAANWERAIERTAAMMDMTKGIQPSAAEAA
jgi:hypothetical protein